MAEVFTSENDVVFGIASEVESLITSKVTITKKVERKELRGRQGGYKAVVAYAKTYEASVEGAIGANQNGTELAGTVSLAFDMTTPVFFVESITINEKNDDFKTVSLTLFGSDEVSLG